MPTTREMVRDKVLGLLGANPDGMNYPALRTACYPMPISDALESLDKEGLIRFEKDSMKWFAVKGKEIAVDAPAMCDDCVYLSPKSDTCEYLQLPVINGRRIYQCLAQDHKWTNSLKPHLHNRLACEPDPWTEKEEEEKDDNDA